MAKKPVPRGEKVASWVLVALLAALVPLVLGHGGYDEAADGAPPGKAGGGKAPGPALHALPEGWSAPAGWESLPEERLYERIDGRDVLFTQHGTERLDFAAVSRGALSLDVYYFVMKSADAALGIFLAETPPSFEESDIAPRADVSGGMARAVKGRTYLVVTARGKAADAGPALELARRLVEEIPVDGPADGGTAGMLPAAGQVKGSLSLNKAAAFGLVSLAGTFSAEYEAGGESYVLLAGSAAGGGAAAVARVRAEIVEFGAAIIAETPTSLAARFMGRSLVLEARGDALVGLYGEPEPARARALLDASFGGAGKGGAAGGG